MKLLPILPFVSALAGVVLAGILGGCSPDKVAGGTATGNPEGVVSARVVDETGSPRGGVALRLLPEDHIPHSAATEGFNAVTDAAGEAHIVEVPRGRYSLTGSDPSTGARALITGINVFGADTARPAVDTLRLPGSIEVTLDAARFIGRGYLYVPGTEIFIPIDSSGAYLIDSIPPGVVEVLYFADTLSRAVQLGPEYRSVRVLSGVTHRPGVPDSATLVDIPRAAYLRVAVDGAGHVWAATDRAGAVRYDGAVWTVYGADQGLMDREVTALEADPSGHMWAASREMLFRYEADAWARISYPDSLVNGPISAITFDSSGGAWFVGTGGFLRLDGQNWSRRYGNAGITGQSAFTDPLGNVWVGTLAHGLVNNPGANEVFYRMANNTGADLVSDDVSAVAMDPHGALWMGHGSLDWGVSRYDGSQWSKPGATDRLVRHVNGIAVEAQGRIWFATEQGVAREASGSWSIWDESSGLMDYNIRDIAIDGSGRAWIVCQRGLSVFVEGAWKHYAPR